MTGRALDLLDEPLAEGGDVQEAGQRVGPRHHPLGLESPQAGGDPEPCDQLLGAGRADQIVVGAGVEGVRQERLALLAQHHDRGPAGPQIPHPPDQREPLVGRSVERQEDRIDPGRREGLLRGAGRLGRDAVGAQDGAEPRLSCGVGVRDQNARGGVR